MKKLLAVLCASVMLFATAVPALAASADPFALTPQKDILAKIPDVAPAGQIIYGSTTDVNADFISGWTNSATNQDIKTLIHSGYETIQYTKDNGFQINPIAVKKWSNNMNSDGSKTYTFEIYDNLVYNDGSKITAKDYCFGILFSASGAFKEIGATSGGNDILVGYDEFYNQETYTFSGVRLLDEYTFSVTVKAEEIPNYYEFAYVGIGPSPMHVMAPGVTLEDNGDGCSLSDNFTAELLMETINNPNTGYRYYPLVTSGPYQFVSYDTSSKTVVVTVNPNYLGNSDGTKPQIKTLMIKLVVQATMLDELAAGQVDLLAGVGGGERITRGLDLVDEGLADYATYLRAGYGYIGFHYDWGPTQFTSVHQAIAYCLDRVEFARAFTQGYGISVHGYYGASQWEYEKNKEALEAQLNPYSKNLDEANRVLDEDEWTLNETGGAYVAGEGKIRHKMVDGELMPLIIEWLCTENNVVSDLIGTMLPGEAEKVGIKINRTQTDFSTLQSHFNRVGDIEPTYHMFNLATGFNTTNPVWYYYNMDDAWLGQYNSTFTQDQELYDLAVAMKQTDPTDTDGWAEKWLQFQLRWNYLMPQIPLYSDLYHDFFNPKLKGYEPTPLWSFRYAIQRAYVK